MAENCEYSLKVVRIEEGEKKDFRVVFLNYDLGEKSVEIDEEDYESFRPGWIYSGIFKEGVLEKILQGNETLLDFTKNQNKKFWLF